MFSADVLVEKLPASLPLTTENAVTIFDLIETPVSLRNFAIKLIELGSFPETIVMGTVYPRLDLALRLYTLSKELEDIPAYFYPRYYDRIIVLNSPDQGETVEMIPERIAVILRELGCPAPLVDGLAKIVIKEPKQNNLAKLKVSLAMRLDEFNPDPGFEFIINPENTYTKALELGASEDIARQVAGTLKPMMIGVVVDARYYADELQDHIDELKQESEGMSFMDLVMRIYDKMENSDRQN